MDIEVEDIDDLRHGAKTDRATVPAAPACGTVHARQVAETR